MSSSGAASPPWVGVGESRGKDEAKVKEQILALSADEKNFLRPPPGGAAFQFDYDAMHPVALATLEADPKLQDARFKLVPARIKEEEFWRNYFYRVQLILES